MGFVIDCEPFIEIDGHFCLFVKINLYYKYKRMEIDLSVDLNLDHCCRIMIFG